LAVTRMFLCTGGLLQARGQLIQVLYLTLCRLTNHLYHWNRTLFYQFCFLEMHT
jgi:hypothetical protein